MNIELLLELKKSGYKLKSFNSGLNIEPHPIFRTSFSEEDMFYQPTLSELIEACGDRFYSLTRRIDDHNVTQFWEAAGNMSDMPQLRMKFEGRNGSTPEEAVANLWLELNKKA